MEAVGDNSETGELAIERALSIIWCLGTNIDNMVPMLGAAVFQETLRRLDGREGSPVGDDQVAELG